MPAATSEELFVKFSSIDEIQEFVTIIQEFKGDVDLKQGRAIVDAKSVLGIYSMNMNEGMRIQVFNGDVKELAEMIQHFLV